jgi:hypothetical protein
MLTFSAIYFKVKSMTLEDKVYVRQLSNKYYNLGCIRTDYGCEICGNEDTDMHHVNYEDPLDIRWLCPEHHILADKLMRQGKPFDENREWVAQYWPNIRKELAERVAKRKEKP